MIAKEEVVRKLRIRDLKSIRKDALEMLKAPGLPGSMQKDYILAMRRILDNLESYLTEKPN